MSGVEEAVNQALAMNAAAVRAHNARRGKIPTLPPLTVMPNVLSAGLPNSALPLRSAETAYRRD
jgi:hypothetical protein